MAITVMATLRRQTFSATFAARIMTNSADNETT
jgi:hypothetical protein